MRERMLFVTAREQQVPVQAWDSHIPGLVITTIPVTEMETGYRVTHEHSGHALSVLVLPSIDFALVFCEETKSISNWTMTQDEFNKMTADDREKLRNKLKKAADKLEEQIENDPSSVLRRAIKIKADNDLTEVI